MDCIETVKGWIEEKGLIGSGDHVTAAVSGGPDSMAMLSILHRLSGEAGFTLSAASFDHRIRKESAAELRLVEELCARLGVSLLTGSADVPAAARQSDRGLEDAAREARYAFLEKADGLIALGHHRDDQVETVLYNIIRGTGLRGLAGIPARRGRLIRPVLCCGAGDLLEYCREHRIEFALDRSNEDRSFMRNRIRHSLLPDLREGYNPSVDEAVLRLSDNARDGLEALREGIRGRIPELSGDGSVTIDGADAGALADYHLYLLVDTILRDRLGVFRDMTRKQFEAVSGLIRSGRSGKMITLPFGVTAAAEHGTVRFAPAAGAAPPTVPDAVVIPGEGEYRLPGWNVTVTVRTEPPQQAPVSVTDSSGTFASVSFPVVVRARREGDRIVPFGMEGRKKLSDIMIDAKVPVRRRGSIPVFEDAEGIFWVPGLVAAERTRVDGEGGKVTVISISH